MRKKTKRKIIICILFTIIILLAIIYSRIIELSIINKHFAKNMIQISKNNEEEVFKVEKIVLCSSANAIDKSEEQNLQDLSIYQYTDIAVYINNGEELSNKNTINRMYIDNISLEGNSKKGKKFLQYKNPLNFGLKPEFFEKNLQTPDNIDFKVIYTNKENKNANYEEPSFYTDCSNPITLQYINYDLETGYKMEENDTISFNGKILKSAGINNKDLECRIRFKINIINNQHEKYTCWINFKLPVDDIFEGTSMKLKETNASKYKFFRE